MNSSNKMKLILPFLIILLSTPAFSQSEISIGAGLGGGVMSSNSPNVSGFNTNVFIQGKPWYGKYFDTRLSIFFMKDFEAIIPDSRQVYLPYTWGASLKAMISQKQENGLYFEEGAGLLLINNHIFSGNGEWNYGALFSLCSGFDLSHYRIGLATEYGLTFNQSSPKYFSISAQVQYYLN